MLTAVFHFADFWSKSRYMTSWSLFSLQFLTGLKGHFDIPKKCKKILQIAIMDIEAGKCSNAFKLKQFDDDRVMKTDAWVED